MKRYDSFRQEAPDYFRELWSYAMGSDPTDIWNDLMDHQVRLRSTPRCDGWSKEEYLAMRNEQYKALFKFLFRQPQFLQRGNTATVYHACCLTDHIVANHDIGIPEFRWVLAGCLWLSSKQNDVYHMDAEFVCGHFKEFTQLDLVTAEVDMLRFLNWDVGMITPLSFFPMRDEFSVRLPNFLQFADLLTGVLVCTLFQIDQLDGYLPSDVFMASMFHLLNYQQRLDHITAPWMTLEAISIAGYLLPGMVGGESQ